MPQQPTRLTPLARTLRHLLLGASLSFSALPYAMAAEAKPYQIAPTSLEAALNQFGREAGVLISGSYPLDDSERILDLLQISLPVKVRRFTRYWVSVEARA